MTDPMIIQIPSEIENVQLPTPELLTFYKDKEHRCLWIDDEINNLSLEICRLIIQWNREDENQPISNRTPIKLFFFSSGGDLDVNYTIIDTIKMSKTPVYGINMGSCCSAAAYIYLACHKRFMLPHSYFLFHQGSSQMSGTYGEIVAAMEAYQSQVNELSSFMKERTNYTLDEITDNIVGEWYVRKDEAIEKGVCHQIVDDMAILL